MTTIAATISSLLLARTNCGVSGNTEWYERHTMRIEQLVRDTGPSGSGIDKGTVLVYTRSSPLRLVFAFEYHHMNDVGMYDGWTYHTAVVTPRFSDIDVRITGPNRNDIKEYLHQVLYAWLTSEEPKK